MTEYSTRGMEITGMAWHLLAVYRAFQPLWASESATSQPGLGGGAVLADARALVKVRVDLKGRRMDIGANDSFPPEIFLPKVCVHANPGFWGWPKVFKADPQLERTDRQPRLRQHGRRRVRMPHGTRMAPRTRSGDEWGT